MWLFVHFKIVQHVCTIDTVDCSGTIVKMSAVIHKQWVTVQAIMKSVVVYIHSYSYYL